MAEWIALDRVDPFGEWRADLRAGIVASTLANANRGKDTKVFAPKDFMPFWKIDSDNLRTENLPEVETLDEKICGVFGALAKNKPAAGQ